MSDVDVLATTAIAAAAVVFCPCGRFPSSLTPS